MQHAQLNDLAEAELDRLRADGIDPNDADIVRINALAWRVETPETRRLLSRGVPVSVGGATLWPLTLLASDWFDRVGAHMRGRTATYALAYAMAHGRGSGTAMDAEGREAERAVRAWARRLRCTDGELEVAIAQVFDQDAEPELPPGVDGKPMTPGDFSAHLAAAVGGTADFWERRCALSYAFAVMAAAAAQNRADGQPNAGDPRLRAERALGLAIDRIRKREARHGAAA